MVRRSWLVLLLAVCVPLATVAVIAVGSTRPADAAVTGIYYIRAVNTDICLDSAEQQHAYVKTNECNGGAYQKWRRNPPLWEARNQLGWCLKATTGVSFNYIVIKEKCNRSLPSQAWKARDVNGAIARWESFGFPGRCLHVYQMGKNAILSDCRSAVWWHAQQTTM